MRIFENIDCLQGCKTLPDKSVDCVITSPPYWQLRDYGYPEQWGLEPTYQEYLEHLWSLMDEIYRVLKPEGTVWVNLGDTYSSSGGCGWTGLESENFKQKAQPHQVKDMPKKCLMLIPHRFAIGCIERGWIVRNDIIWAKRNGMPESVTDRFSRKHEYFFLMVKNQKYYFDLDGVRDRTKPESIERAKGVYNGSYANANKTGIGVKLEYGNPDRFCNPLGKNPGDVSDFWDIPTKPSSEKHYAMFNSDLIDKPIIAGCPEGGTILDPFAGMGTTLVRAIELNRNVIGFELSKEYYPEAKNRIEQARFAREAKVSETCVTKGLALFEEE